MLSSTANFYGNFDSINNVPAEVPQLSVHIFFFFLSAHKGLLVSLQSKIGLTSPCLGFPVNMKFFYYHTARFGFLTSMSKNAVLTLKKHYSHSLYGA